MHPCTCTCTGICTTACTRPCTPAVPHRGHRCTHRSASFRRSIGRIRLTRAHGYARTHTWPDRANPQSKPVQDWPCLTVKFSHIYRVKDVSFAILDILPEFYTGLQVVGCQTVKTEKSGLRARNSTRLAIIDTVLTRLAIIKPLAGLTRPLNTVNTVKYRVQIWPQECNYACKLALMPRLTVFS